MKHACSTTCQPFRHSPSSYPRGVCHNHVALTYRGQATSGWVRKANERRTERARSNGATQYVRIGSGKPRTTGNNGQPNQMSGGAIIINSKCCNMWTCSNSDANGSIGE